MGAKASERADEVRALRLGVDLGLRIIDTAEMYDRAEEVVGEAVTGRRDEVTLVSKVLPTNASYRGTIEAAERSLRRLRTDRIDLYLLHWRGGHPLEETRAAFEQLQADGKIVEWGVSNFDVAGLNEPGLATPACDQVLFNLQRRGCEWDLLPHCRERGIPVMAYSPLEQARLEVRPALREVAERLAATPYQVALAWVLEREDLVAIPKAVRGEHVRENAAAAALTLRADDHARLDADYPPPDGPTPLETL